MATAQYGTLVIGRVATGAFSQFTAAGPGGEQPAAGGAAIGIWQYDTTAGARTAVMTAGISSAIAGAALSLGQPLQVGASGRLVPLTDGGQRLGFALGDVASAGTAFELLIAPGSGTGLPATVTAAAAADVSGMADGQRVLARGRTTATDGGGGWLTYLASSTATVDNVVVFAPSVGTGRLVRDGYVNGVFNGRINLLWAGPALDGTTASDAAFTRAKLAAAALRAPIDIPPGTFALAATFVNDAAVTWCGAGGGIIGQTSQPVSDFLASSMTIIQPAAGFAVDTPLWWERPASVNGGIQRAGGGVQGVTFYGNNIANCMRVDSVIGATYSNLLALKGRTWGYRIGVAYDPLGAGMGSCVFNVFTNVDGIFSPNGCILCGDSTVGYNASLNRFDSCNMRGGTVGWVMENCDSNYLWACGGVMELRAGDGMSFSVGTDRSARANYILAFQGGITAKASLNPGASPHSYRNTVFISRENGANLTKEAGAKVIELQDQSAIGGDVSGRVIGYEKSGVLLSKGGQTITNATNTVLAWTVETYDTDGFHEPTIDNTVITVPPGVNAIRVSAQVAWSSSQTAGNRTVRILKNGASYPGMPEVTRPGTVLSPMYVETPLLDVDPGDTFQVQVYQDAGGGTTVLTGDLTWFHGQPL